MAKLKSSRSKLKKGGAPAPPDSQYAKPVQAPRSDRGGRVMGARIVLFVFALAVVGWIVHFVYSIVG